MYNSKSSLSTVAESATKGAIIGSTVYTALVTSVMYGIYLDAGKDQDIHHRGSMATSSLLGFAALCTAPIVGGSVGAVIGAGYGCLNLMIQNNQKGECAHRPQGTHNL